MATEFGITTCSPGRVIEFHCSVKTTCHARHGPKISLQSRQGQWMVIVGYTTDDKGEETFSFSLSLLSLSLAEQTKRCWRKTKTTSIAGTCDHEAQTPLAGLASQRCPRAATRGSPSPRPQFARRRVCVDIFQWLVVCSGAESGMDGLFAAAAQPRGGGTCPRPRACFQHFHDKGQPGRRRHTGVVASGGGSVSRLGSGHCERECGAHTNAHATVRRMHAQKQGAVGGDGPRLSVKATRQAGR